MNAYFYYFYNMMRNIFGLLWNIVLAIRDAIVGILDIDFYIRLFDTYRDDLSPIGWVAALITHIIILLIFILLVYLLFRGVRVLLRFKVPVVEYERMKDEIVTLKREIMKANYEKDKILAMKISDLGMEVNPELMKSGLNEPAADEPDKKNGTDAEEAAQADTPAETKADELLAAFSGESEQAAPAADSADETGAAGEAEEEAAPLTNDEKKRYSVFHFDGERRFPRLTSVDQLYMSPQYEAPQYRMDYNLEELCVLFRNFSAGKLGLYYELELIKQVFASFGAAKMLILQGISGTGKTSLPYALGQFIENPSLICSVQPSWRDRTELFGYYNDFTKKYTETEFLKTLYECHFQEDLRFIILDEMNIARVEYYFAEMLSILELPREDERYVSVVSNGADGDPYKMVDGKIWIPSNALYVGTINNDDSTFAVADKVYDRAIPIDLDDKASPFETPDTPSMRVSYTYLNSLYDVAKQTYTISEENLMELERLDAYLIKHFRLTFGNRIMRQIKDFVPCYIACGGTELGGIDFMFAKKILRKFESLGLGFIRDEIDGLVLYLEKTFGEDEMKISREYLLRLKRMSSGG
ncbi:MAG: hypothetical protein IJ711_11725 [Lachnospiraceae bacterium]|nr:hypothetical protein [Lachnospiraceae bacterium]